jgi:phosphopantetheinyl transferase
VARTWGSAALAVACAERGPASPRVALVVRRRPFERLARSARRRARSAAAREAAYIAATDLVPGLDSTALSVLSDPDGPPRLRGTADDLQVSLSHCGDLVAAAVGQA